MKIVICGSIAFIDKMQEAKKLLEELGHEVKMPPLQILDKDGRMVAAKEYYTLRKSITDDNHWVWDVKEWAIRTHFKKVAWSEAILVLNYDKNSIAGYIGANTLLEIGLAFYLRKKIYLLNRIPEISYKEEILAMKPIVLNGDLSKINE